MIDKILISLNDKKCVRWIDKNANVIPIMTSNTTPNGVANASKGDAWKAFNGIYTGNSSETWTSSGSTTGWLSYEFNAPKAINSYQMRVRNDSEFQSLTAPKDWTFEGSNDGQNWTILDTQKSVDWSNLDGEFKTFNFANKKEYKSYKINVSANGGHSNLIISELAMFSDSHWEALGERFSEQDFLVYGMDKSDIELIPESAWRELDGHAISILEYTDSPNQTESIVETETEPYTIYDEFGDSMEVLYYTDDPDKEEAELDIVANYSPLDDLEGDFEIVTWTDDTEEKMLNMNALPEGQFIHVVDKLEINGDLNGIIVNEEFFDSEENGIVRYLISNNANDWYAWNDDDFALLLNIDNIANDGMTLETINQLISDNWSKWNHDKLFIGVYLDEDIRDKTKAYVDNITVELSLPTKTPVIDDARLYILNTTATINVDFTGSTVSGYVEDEDSTRVQYRIILNDENYFPVDGEFTPLAPSPLSINLTIPNEDIKIDENNTLRIEFQDYWGSMDYWQTNFVGTYSGLLFTDEQGGYYSSEIGEILKYLDFGIITAGQTTIDHAIKLKNTYGYSVDNIRITVNESDFPDGMQVQFSKTQTPFQSEKSLTYNEIMNDGDEKTFYIRLATQLGVTPNANGMFDIVVKADKVTDDNSG